MTNQTPHTFYYSFAESGVGSVVKAYGGHVLELTNCYRSDDGLNFVLCFKGQDLSGEEWEAEASLTLATMTDFVERKAIELNLYKTCEVRDWDAYSSKRGKTKVAHTFFERFHAGLAD